MTLLYVALGGAIGSVARYVVAERVNGWTDYAAAGTLMVNVAGSFLIGLLLTLGESRFDWPQDLRVFIAAGFLGGFTTFSALTWQTYRYADAGDAGAAAVNVGLSVVLGVLAVWAGASLARVG